MYQTIEHHAETPSVAAATGNGLWIWGKPAGNVRISERALDSFQGAFVSPLRVRAGEPGDIPACHRSPRLQALEEAVRGKTDRQSRHQRFERIGRNILREIMESDAPTSRSSRIKRFRPVETKATIIFFANDSVMAAFLRRGQGRWRDDRCRAAVAIKVTCRA